MIEELFYLHNIEWQKEKGIKQEKIVNVSKK